MELTRPHTPPGTELEGRGQSWRGGANQAHCSTELFPAGSVSALLGFGHALAQFPTLSPYSSLWEENARTRVLYAFFNYRGFTDRRQP